ncbi:MAG: [Ruminococcus sp.]|nr:[FeFe] hydrogenase H-cluster maturation GTPase HydF [Ruminococcus sp.]
MSMNDTPSSERVHIGFFGRRNAGKSSVVNAVTSQQLSVVSDTPGTTTDPVRKAMELLPMGPVVIIDTPGFDDEGELGELRVAATSKVLKTADCAVLVTDSTRPADSCERELIALFEKNRIPYIIAKNKTDLLDEKPSPAENEVYCSALDGTGINELKERIALLVKTDEEQKRLVGDILPAGSLALLVIPIDKAAPKGRLILPQQQTIRDLLDSGCAAVTVRDTELKETIEKLSPKPALVITDSQAFKEADRDTPPEIPLTSFSILMARYKGYLEEAVKGAAAIPKLKDGDKVLISEGCTHHRQCGDIGTVKLPALLKKTTGKTLDLSFTSGRDFPEELSGYALVIHCGGCMLTERDVRGRMRTAAEQGVPFTNYGIALAMMNGILKRSLGIFPDLCALV